MWQLLIDYNYVFDYNWFLIRFSVQLPIMYAWHRHLLCAALSSNVGSWGLWACSLSLSLIFKRCERERKKAIGGKETGGERIHQPTKGSVSWEEYPAEGVSSQPE